MTPDGLKAENERLRAEVERLRGDAEKLRETLGVISLAREQHKGIGFCVQIALMGLQGHDFR